MRRLTLPIVLPALLALWPGAARADRQSEIIAELKSEGYADIEVGRTWLRRVRIVAAGPRGAREIVIDPRNDEILRDYETPAAAPADGGLYRGEGDRPAPPPRTALPGQVLPGGSDRPGPGDRPHPDRPGSPGPGGARPERPAPGSTDGQ